MARLQERPVTTAPLIQGMIERIVQTCHPSRVILFGSYARGGADARSDVDLLVVLPRVRDKHRAAVDIRRALADFPVPKDIVVTSVREVTRRGDLVGTILRPALREGITLYDAEGAGPHPSARSGRRASGGSSPVPEGERLLETRRWLRYAHADLTAAAAGLTSPGLAPQHSCWLAHQAAEKALKAVLVFLQADFPRTHDLDALRDLVPPGWRLKGEHPALGELSQWAVHARYPGDWPEPTEADARHAVGQARALWESVLRDLAERGLEPEAGR